MRRALSCVIVRYHASCVVVNCRASWGCCELTTFFCREPATKTDEHDTGCVLVLCVDREAGPSIEVPIIARHVVCP